MAKIVQKENPILREIAQPVKKADFKTPALFEVIDKMSKALDREDDGVALAAPQIGIPLRIFIVSKKIFSEEEEPQEDIVFINPKITRLSKKQEWIDEGCLSVRWLYGKVKRATKASVEAYDQAGQKFSWNGSDLMAQIFQHEIDHLDGILFTDKAKDLREIHINDLDKENAN